MRTKNIVSFLLVFYCVSCDISKPFVIDGKKEYVLSGECGTIKIRGSSLPTHPILFGCTFNGKYLINTDSLKIEAVPDVVVVTNISFRLNHEDFRGTEIETKTGESLSFWVNVKSTTPFRRSETMLLILPSNFITCEGKPIITDTIRVRLRN